MERFLAWHDGPTAHERAAALRATVLDPSKTPSDRENAAVKLASTREGGEVLLQLPEAGKLPEPVRDAVANVIYQNPDITVRSLATRHFRSQGAPASMPAPAEILALRGDPTRGRTLFHDRSAASSSCHAFRGEGRDVGPDLGAIAKKYDRPALLDAILNPSAAILSGFETHVLETKGGEIYTGFLLSDGDVVILKDTQGARHTIARADIRERYQQKQSIMPDNAATGL